MTWTTRILPRDEWPRLQGTEAEALWPTIPDGGGDIVVVECDGVIVGCWALLRVLHAECVWIHPDHRGKPAVAKRLLVGMHRQAAAAAVASVVTSADNDQVRSILARLGATEVPGTLYVVPVDRLAR